MPNNPTFEEVCCSHGTGCVMSPTDDQPARNNLVSFTWTFTGCPGAAPANYFIREVYGTICIEGEGVRYSYLIYRVSFTLLYISCVTPTTSYNKTCIIKLY